MTLFDLFDYTFKSYISGIKLMLFFSLPLLLAFFIPIFVQTPAYIAMGGVYLRTGSIPEITEAELALMIVSFLASLFLISFTIVNINLVIKSQRTGVFVKREVIDGIGRYSINVFWIFLTYMLASLIVQLLVADSPYASLLSPLANLLLFIPVFYAPAALVIDDVRPWRALENSTWMVIRKFPFFILWVLLAFILISVLQLLVYVVPGIDAYAPYILLALNSIFLMPFLLVLQTQIYLTKYTIIR